MCDFVSWLSKRTRKGTEIRFLTDDMIEAKWGTDAKNLHYMQNKIGHDGIRAYFGVEELQEIWVEKESYMKIPPVIAKEVNDGNMDKMMEAWNNFRPLRLRYTAEGNLKSINGVLLEELTIDTNGFIWEYPTVPEFKVGDKVIVGYHKIEERFNQEKYPSREILIALALKGKGITSRDLDAWCSDMNEFFGKVVTVESLSTENYYEPDSEPHFHVEETCRYFHNGACRLATPEEIEAGHAL